MKLKETKNIDKSNREVVSIKEYVKENFQFLSIYCIILFGILQLNSFLEIIIYQHIYNINKSHLIMQNNSIYDYLIYIVFIIVAYAITNKIANVFNKIDNKIKYKILKIILKNIILLIMSCIISIIYLNIQTEANIIIGTIVSYITISCIIFFSKSKKHKIFDEKIEKITTEITGDNPINILLVGILIFIFSVTLLISFTNYINISNTKNYSTIDDSRVVIYSTNSYYIVSPHKIDENNIIIIDATRQTKINNNNITITNKRFSDSKINK